MFLAWLYVLLVFTSSLVFCLYFLCLVLGRRNLHEGVGRVKVVALVFRSEGTCWNFRFKKVARYRRICNTLFILNNLVDFLYALIMTVLYVT